METTKKSARNLSKFCQMAVSRRLASRAPQWVSQACVSLLGHWYYCRHPQERALIGETVNRVLGPSSGPVAAWRQRRIFQGIFRHYQEKLFLAYAPEQKVQAFLQKRLSLEGEEELQQALEQRRGVILVTGHYGAVEFLPAALGLRGYPVAVIVRPQTPELAASMARRAALVNLTLIIPANGKVLPAALQALRAGRILITEMDEFEMWRSQGAEPLSFLGCVLPGDRTLEVLQKRSGAPVLTGLVHRWPGRRYQLALEPLAAAAYQGGVGRHCLRRLEQAIRTAPEQWYQWKEFGKVVAQVAAPGRPAVQPVATPAPQPLGQYVPA